jgi:hypothetical protein
VLYEPVIRYPTGGTLVPLPLVLTDEGADYLEKVVQTELAQHDEFLLFGIDSYSTREYRAWLLGRTLGLHYQARSLGNYDGIEVTAFQRSRP